MNAAVPAYRKIADDLRRRITSGELSPGSLLPTQQELATTYGVARMTARQALSSLENEGLITSQQGRGTMVRGRQTMVYRPQAEFAPRTSAEMDRFMSALASEGRAPSQTIDVAIVPAPQIIAERLGIAPGSKVVVRQRVRSIDGEPFNINDTFYPYELASTTEIMDPEDIPRGSNFVLADRGYKEVRAIDEIYIRMPEPEEVRRLQLRPGTPVGVHYATGFTAKGEPIRCDMFVLPGDRHVILLERVHPDGRDNDESGTEE
jgi:GntR family transcriptional regulator